MGSEAKTAGVGIFVAEKCVDSVVSVERHSERIMVLKMVVGDRLLNVFSIYATATQKVLHNTMQTSILACAHKLTVSQFHPITLINT